ncbi:at4g32400 related [Cystoisospora suis]|uniref:At4g32400 related n=1 Tax=Cystoisospora suis TaxID=483139 RepID=A0A2C6KIB1_9APIC|nr:at4g32400 related [Cystoisospora suis]
MPPPSSSLPLWRDERSLLVRKILKSSRPTSSGDCSRESDGSFSGSSGYVGLGDGSIVYKPIQSLTASCEVSSHTHGVFPSCASPAGGILSLHAIRERDDEDLSSSSSSSSASSSSSLSSSVKEKEEMRDTEDVKKRKSVMKEVLPSQQSTTISCINHADLELNETDAEEDEEEEEDEENREVEKTMIGREDACLNPGVYTPDDGSGGRHYESLNKTGGRGDIFSSLTLDRFYRKDLQQEEEKRMQETKHISQVSRQKPSSSSGVHTPHGQHHKDISPSSSTTKPTRISSSSSSSSSSCAEDYATYQRVRLQLLSLQYHESFDPVNTRLVDRLLQDVVKAVENFQILMKRYRDAESQLGEQKKVLSMAVNARDHLRSEVSRLKENLKQSERELKRKEKEWTEEKRKKDAYVGSLEEILKKKKEDLYTTHTKLRRLREQYTLIKEEVEKNAPRYGYARKDYSLHLTLPLKSNNRRHHLDAPASTFHQHYHNSKNRRPSLPPRSQPSSCRLRRFSTASEKRREEEEELLSPSEEERKQGEEELLNEEKNESSDADKEDEEEEEETTDRQEKYSSGTEKRNRDRRESAKEESKYLQSELLKYKALAEKLRLKLDARQDYSSLSSQAKEEDEEEKKKKKKEDGEERDGLFESEDRENYWRDQAMKKEEEILHISQQFNHLNSLYQALRLRSKPMRGVKGFSLSSSSSSSSSFCKKPRLLSRGGPGPPSYPQHLLKKHSSSLLSSSSPAFPTQAKKRIPRREGDKKEGKEKSPAIPRDKKNAESKSRMTGKERDRKEEEEDEEVDKGEDDDEKKKKRKEKFVKDKKKTDIDGIEEEEEGQKVKNDKEEEDEEGKDRVKALTYSLATAQSRYEEACKELSRYQQLLLQEASIHKKTQDNVNAQCPSVCTPIFAKPASFSPVFFFSSSVISPSLLL